MAVRVIRSRAAEWQIKPHRLGVLGYSAGSHLALSLLQAKDTDAPENTDPLAKISIRLDFTILLCPWSQDREAADIHLPQSSPPTFMAHAEDDELAPVAIARNIKKQLDALGRPGAVEAGTSWQAQRLQLRPAGQTVENSMDRGSPGLVNGTEVSLRRPETDVRRCGARFRTVGFALATPDIGAYHLLQKDTHSTWSR